MAAKKQNGRQITKLSITGSFLELHSPDFEWKFVWTVQTSRIQEMKFGLYNV